MTSSPLSHLADHESSLHNKAAEGPPAQTSGRCLTLDQRRCLVAEAHQWFREGVTHYRQGQYTAALSRLQQALRTYHSLRDRRGEGRVLIILTRLYYHLADYLWALDTARQAQRLARQVGDSQMLHQALSYLGNSYRHLGNLPQALDYGHQSLILARQVCDRTAEMCSLNNLAMVLRAQGQPQQAIAYYGQSLALARQHQDRQTEIQILQNLGNTYRALGDAHNVLQTYAYLLKLSSHSKTSQPSAHIDMPSLGYILQTLGHACDQLGEHGLAIEYWQRALALVRKLGDARREAEILEHLGNKHDVSVKTVDPLARHQHQPDRSPLPSTLILQQD